MTLTSEQPRCGLLFVSTTAKLLAKGGSSPVSQLSPAFVQASNYASSPPPPLLPPPNPTSPELARLRVRRCLKSCFFDKSTEFLSHSYNTTPANRNTGCRWQLSWECSSVGADWLPLYLAAPVSNGKFPKAQRSIQIISIDTQKIALFSVGLGNRAFASFFQSTHARD